MTPRWIFWLFVAASAVQLAVPIGHIRTYEDILQTGTVYKFRTAPVDPYDAFRGRYVALNYAGTEAAVSPPGRFKNGESVYVSLHRTGDGFAQFGELTVEPPDKGDYLRVVLQHSGETSATKAHFRLPFDRFFMEETKAPLAEEAYRKHGSRRGQPGSTFVVVRVKGGRGVIENLYIQDKPIDDFLAEDAARR